MIGPYKNTPTLDIYFREPLRDLISILPFAAPSRPILRLGPNSFIAGRSAVIVRYATPRELARLARSGADNIYYVIDDDLLGLDCDRSLPSDYRRRLQAFTEAVLPRILALARTIVSPSPIILKGFGGHQTALLSPAYLSVCDQFDHFGAETVDAVFPGTRSHIEDLANIASAVREAVETHADLTVTTFLGEHGEGVLGAHERIVHRAPQSWVRFRKTLARERFQLALVPYRDTAFNRARSINKIHDVAAFGACGLFSNRPPSSDVVRPGETGLLLGDDVGDWARAISTLIRDRRGGNQTMAVMARGNAALSRRLGDPARVRRFWIDRLGLGETELEL